MSKRKSRETVTHTEVPILKSSAMRIKDRYPGLPLARALDKLLNETAERVDIICEKKAPDPTRVRILNQGAALTTGQRNAAYGNPVTNMQHMAGMLTAYFANLISRQKRDDGSDAELGEPYIFTGEDAAQIMVIAKQSRTANRGVPYHEDNYTDAAVYSAMAGECAEEER